MPISLWPESNVLVGGRLFRLKGPGEALAEAQVGGPSSVPAGMGSAAGGGGVSTLVAAGPESAGAEPPRPSIPADRLRILVVTNMYPPHAYGGYELGCRDVVERWRRRGHEVLVLTSTVEVAGVPRAPAHERARVRRELQLYWDDHVILRPSVRNRLACERANRTAFDRVVAEFRPDVCSVWAMGAMSLGVIARAEARGLAVVPVICDEWPVYGPHLDAWLRLFAGNPVRRAAGRLAQAVTGLPTRPPLLDRLGPACFGSEALRAAVRRGARWTFPDSAVVPWGVDTTLFGPGDPSGPSIEVRAQRWSWKLLVVGRIDPRKGIDVAIRALAQCPPTATLAVVGRGDDRHRGELDALARSLGVTARVRFDEVPRSELAAHYRGADVLIFPPRWEEPFGLVPLEAMACGTAVVASPTGGAAEFLVDVDADPDAAIRDAVGNCVTFPSGDVDGLVAALHRMAAAPELRARVVAAGLATAGRLTVDTLADSLEDWHQLAVRRAHPATT